MRLGHVHRGPLVADIDDADALGVEPHPDRHDVAAAEREDALHATALQQARDEARHAVGMDHHAAPPHSPVRARGRPGPAPRMGGNPSGSPASVCAIPTGHGYTVTSVTSPSGSSYYAVFRGK